MATNVQQLVALSSAEVRCKLCHQCSPFLIFFVLFMVVYMKQRANATLIGESFVALQLVDAQTLDNADYVRFF